MKALLSYVVIAATIWVLIDFSIRPRPVVFATWYGEEYRGQLMANGHPYDPDDMTCASWNYPLGTVLQVRKGDLWVEVTVTDRGPNRLLTHNGQVIDLSKRAFSLLADPGCGIVEVTVIEIPTE